MGQQPLMGQGPLIIDASRSHTNIVITKIVEKYFMAQCFWVESRWNFWLTGKYRQLILQNFTIYGSIDLEVFFLPKRHNKIRKTGTEE